MMTLEYVGDQEAMVYAQLGQQPLARTTETSLQPRQGTLSCLARAASCSRHCDGRTARGGVRAAEHCLPFLYSKRTAVTRSLVSRVMDEDRSALSPLRPAGSLVELPRPQM